MLRLWILRRKVDRVAFEMLDSTHSFLTVGYLIPYLQLILVYSLGISYVSQGQTQVVTEPSRTTRPT